jgi:hypothetical protein
LFADVLVFVSSLETFSFACIHTILLLASYCYC